MQLYNRQNSLYLDYKAGKDSLNKISKVQKPKSVLVWAFVLVQGVQKVQSIMLCDLKYRFFKKKI